MSCLISRLGDISIRSDIYVSAIIRDALIIIQARRLLYVRRNPT